jgi:hypothetical protein
VAADEQPEERPASAPGPAPRPAPRKPGSDTEKALTLEVARLFGMSPRVLLNRDASPQPPAPVESIMEEDGAADADPG